MPDLPHDHADEPSVDPWGTPVGDRPSGPEGDPLAGPVADPLADSLADDELAARAERAAREADAELVALEELYDRATLDLIDRKAVAPPVVVGTLPATVSGGPPGAQAPAGSAVRRIGLGGAMLAGSMLGLGEVLEPERDKPTIIEFAPEQPDEDEALVTFHHVPGDPRASRLIIRPWLLERFRRRSPES